MITQRPYDVDLIREKNGRRKFAVTYEITHDERQEARGAWVFSKTESHPFNSHLSFSFPVDPSAREDDVLKVRAVAHKLRMWLSSQKPKIPSHLIWTRTSPLGSNMEIVDILIHVPEKDAEAFKNVVEKWEFGIKVEPVTYEADRFYAGKPCTIFDEMFKASSAETRAKVPQAPHQASASMMGNRFFFSKKLSVHQRMEHGKQNRHKTIEGTAIIIG